MKKTGWTVSSSVKFANGTKVDYYDGTAMAMDTKPYIISDKNASKIQEERIYDNWEIAKENYKAREEIRERVEKAV